MNIGDIINYQATKKEKYKAIITQILEPYKEDHGMVEHESGAFSHALAVS